MDFTYPHMKKSNDVGSGLPDARSLALASSLDNS